VTLENIVTSVKCPCTNRQSGCLELFCIEHIAELQASRNQLLQMVQDSFPAEHEALRHDRPLPTSSKIVWFQPFYGDNLIRLGGRLQFADLSHTENHPILLDASHHITHLLIRHTHIQLHHLDVRVVLSHLRHEFWILRARQNIKKDLTHLLTVQNSQ
jgi:hypothetical protein